MNTGIIIQVQMEVDGNKRDDILFDLINSTAIIEYTVMQALKCRVDKVIILSSNGNVECRDLKTIRENNIPVYIKNEASYVKTYREIMDKENLDCMIRVIGPNILLVPEYVDKGVISHIENNADYTYYDSYPTGVVPTEIIGRNALFSKETYENEDGRRRYTTANIKESKNLKINRIRITDKEYFVRYSNVDFSYKKVNLEGFKKIIEQSNNLGHIVENLDLISVPTNVSFCLTNICNINCIMCPNCGDQSEYKEYKEKNGIMSFESFKNVLDKFEDSNIEVQLTGGEILLHKDIKKIIDYCNKKEYKIGILTNGLLLNSDIAEFLIDNVDTMLISIDGSNSDIYNFIRKNGDFNVLTSNLKTFMEIYNNNVNPRLKSIWVNFTYMQQNYEDIPNMLEYIKKIGLNQIQFAPYISFKYINNDKLRNGLLVKDQEKLNSIFERTRLLGKELDLDIDIDVFNEGDLCHQENWNKCYAHSTYYINWDGYIVPCACIPNPSFYNFGNLLEEDIRIITHRWKKFRWNIYNNKPNDICKKYCSI